MEIARGTATRLTFQANRDYNPVWAPDGQRVLFRSTIDEAADLFVKDVSETTPEVRLLRSPGTDAPTDWSPDGQFALFEAPAQIGTSVDIWVYSFANKAASPLLATPFMEQAARFSPDLRWISYSSNESGRAEIYMRPFVHHDGKPALGAKWLVSTEGSLGWPRWRGSGKELFYRHPTGAMMVTEVVTDGASVRTSIPRPLFPMAQTITHWDVTRDGQRFLVAVPTAAPSNATYPITVVVNWQSPRMP
jgi:dipeptidyl aminopeptidase/acylaminoacyl peptidase